MRRSSRVILKRVVKRKKLDLYYIYRILFSRPKGVLMDKFEIEIKQDFLSEALINLEEVESSFLELESSADPKALLDKIFRLAHNLKGGSRTVGFEQISEFTHDLESLVLKIQNSEIKLSTPLVTILLKAKDTLAAMLNELKVDIRSYYKDTEVINEVKSWLHGQKNNQSTQIENKSNDKPVERDPDIVLQTPPKANDSATKVEEIVRVNLSKINQLNDFVGELIVLQSVIQQQSSFATSLTLRNSINQMVKLSKDIQNLAMSLRMLPVKPLLQKLQRVVRDTSQSLGKEIRFNTVGELLDIDKSVLDQLADPLIHIIRNCVDHGIEDSFERVQAGKSPSGQITVKIANEGNHLIVEVIDDGAGINIDKVTQKALEKGLLTETNNLTEKQILNLIFHPGFSTKKEVTELSGRGVGLDVVKKNIEKIGGSVDITTEVSKGSHFTMKIPLTLAVIEGLLVVAESNRYVIPLGQVQETVNLKTQNIFQDQVDLSRSFELRGTIVPVISIDEALDSRKKNSKVGPTALIIKVGDRMIALAVHEILRAQQIVIKPLTNGILAQVGWIGSCILGDGLPAIILNPIELLDRKMTISKINASQEVA